MFSINYREMSYVTRWGVLRRARSQNVAEHQYYVAVYAGLIADTIGYEGDRGNLYRCALIHDLFEGRSGDLPGPFKRQLCVGDAYHKLEVEYFKALFPHELPYLDMLRQDQGIAAIVKAADKMEGCMYLANEHMLGNTYAGDFIDRGSPSQDMYLVYKDSLDALRPYFSATLETHRVEEILASSLLLPIFSAYKRRPDILNGADFI